MVTPRHYSSKFGSAANAVNGFRERIERMLSTDLAAMPGNGLNVCNASQSIDSMAAESIDSTSSNFS